MIPLEQAAENLLSDFEYFDNWEDRYSYIIDLGDKLPDFPEQQKIESHRVQGCVSQVWLNHHDDNGKIYFAATSDSRIVCGLIAILLAIYNGRNASEILNHDSTVFFDRLGFRQHLSPSRSNGFAAMVAKIKNIAGQTAAA